MIHSLMSRRVFTGSALAATALIAGRSKAQQALAPTAESPIGPFYPVDRLAEDDADLTWLKGHSTRALGDIVEVTGRVLDRRGNPVSGARLELWQANAAGRYAHANDISKMPLDPNFQGFASLKTGSSGEWRATTVKPAGYDSPIGKRPPHIHFDVQGGKQRLLAQMYFPEDEAWNRTDRLYSALGDQAATSVAKAAAAGKYRWDIILMDA